MYLSVIAVKRRYRPLKSVEYPEGDRISTHTMLYQAANFAAENPDDDHLLDEIDRDSIEAYSGFKGGFSIDDSVLDSLDDGDDE